MITDESGYTSGFETTPSPQTKANENAEECFTVVFRGNLRKLQGNPHHYETQFGPVLAVGIGNVFEESLPQEHKLALEKAIDFIESLTRDSLLLPDDIEMTLDDVQAHARIELSSIRKVLDASPQGQAEGGKNV